MSKNYESEMGWYMNVQPDEVESIVDIGFGVDRYDVELVFITEDEVYSYSLLLNSIGYLHHEGYVDYTVTGLSEEEKELGMKFIEWKDLPEKVRRAIILDIIDTRESLDLI